MRATEINPDGRVAMGAFIIKWQSPLEIVPTQGGFYLISGGFNARPIVKSGEELLLTPSNASQIAAIPDAPLCEEVV